MHKIAFSSYLQKAGEGRSPPPHTHTSVRVNYYVKRLEGHSVAIQSHFLAVTLYIIVNSAL